MEAEPDTLACPGGESGNDVAAGRRSFLPTSSTTPIRHAKASLRAATSGWGSATPRIERPMLAVAHSTTNRILICVALAIEIREFRRRIDKIERGEEQRAVDALLVHHLQSDVAGSR